MKSSQKSVPQNFPISKIQSSYHALELIPIRLKAQNAGDDGQRRTWMNLFSKLVKYYAYRKLNLHNLKLSFSCPFNQIYIIQKDAKKITSRKENFVSTWTQIFA